MVVIHRRVFFAKVGMAEPLLAQMNEMNDRMAKQGISFKTRSLTDHMSGRTDRVVVEWEVENLRDIEEGLDRAMADPQARAFFAEALEKLNGMIHYAEAENWLLR